MKRTILIVCCNLLVLYTALSQSLPGGSSRYGITVAGGNGPGSAANQLGSALNIFVDEPGNVYITDRFYDRVQKWAPGAAFGTTVAGGNGYGSGAHQLGQPQGIFVDKAGNLFVADGYNSRVQKWSPGATSGITVVRETAVGVNVLENGDLYVANPSGASHIVKYTPGSTVGIVIAGGNGPGAAANQFNAPYDVFFDRAGNMYVADASNNRIQKWAPGARSGTTVAGGNGPGAAANQINFPTSVFVDSIGNVYVADAQNHRVQRWSPGASSGVTVAGGNGQGSAANQLSYPYDAYLDSKGNMYVADGGNYRVQKFESGNPEAACPPNLVFAVQSCNARAVVSWNELKDTFPVAIFPPVELDPHLGTLTFMGALNGHGYYRSTLNYPWPVAADISRYIGDTLVNGHLVTISSDEENNFIYNRIQGTRYSPWIGFSSTGSPGKFQWVNGEPAGYTKWAMGEPNNSRGLASHLREPYVRILDINNGTWNDQRSDYAPFILEFESPVIRYRQVSGPANGSLQPPGTYEVCYEISNLITGEKHTCCFTISVTCTPGINTGYMSDGSNEAPVLKNKLATLHVTTAGNPGSSTFKLTIAGGNDEAVTLHVSDINGKIVESRKGLATGQTLVLGGNYHAGIFLARFTQGSQQVVVKLVKQTK